MNTLKRHEEAKQVKFIYVTNIFNSQRGTITLCNASAKGYLKIKTNLEILQNLWWVFERIAIVI